MTWRSEARPKSASVRVGRGMSRQADPVAAARQRGCPSLPYASRRWWEMKFVTNINVKVELFC
jgi:hypothetical protein